MYCRAHKTATLTPIQHTVGRGNWEAMQSDLVDDQNYCFGLGLTPKPKMADTVTS